MRVRGFLLLTVLMCLLFPMASSAAESNEAGEKRHVLSEGEKETLIKNISQLGGYNLEEEKRTFHVEHGEFEPGGQTGYFISAYKEDNRNFGIWSPIQGLVGDVWAVMDGNYTRIFRDVQLDRQNAGGMELLDMGSRTFVMIRTNQSEESDTGRYFNQKPDRDYLFSFRGEEPVCFLDGMLEAKYRPQRQILTAYFELPMDTCFDDGTMDTSGYRRVPYFFRCEDGELQEIVAESCTEEEFMTEVINLKKAGAVNSFVFGDIDSVVSNFTTDEKKTVFFYRIPGIACGLNLVEYREDETDSLEFQCGMVVDSQLHNDTWEIIGPYGFRYMSWQNREKEEKNLCEVMKEKTGVDLSAMLPFEKREEPIVRMRRATAVRPGDSLSKLAKRLYGDEKKWVELYAGNKEIIGENPSLILPDMVLWTEAEVDTAAETEAGVETEADA